MWPALEPDAAIAAPRGTRPYAAAGGRRTNLLSLGPLTPMLASKTHRIFAAAEASRKEIHR